MTEAKGGGAGHRILVDARQVLDYTLRLELAPARWERVAQIIEAATEAMEAGDLEGLRQAITELKRTSPVRVLRISGTPTVPPTPRVRERAVIMTYSLEKALNASQDETDDEESAG